MTCENNRCDPGFSEEALRGLRELKRRTMPPEVQELFETGMISRGVPNPRPPSRRRGSKRPHYWGHRERLRTRFLEDGGKVMPEYEILELILFNAIGRIDVKPLAKNLLAVFGDLNGVISASRSRLLEVPGTTDRVYYHFRLFDRGYISFEDSGALILCQSLPPEVVSAWGLSVSFEQRPLTKKQAAYMEYHRSEIFGKS